jgi:hypothetical protein
MRLDISVVAGNAKSRIDRHQARDAAQEASSPQWGASSPGRLGRIARRATRQTRSARAGG